MKAPAFQWYAADYLADERVMLLSLESEGAYVRLLNYCWREGSIPANPALCVPMCKYADVKVIKPALGLFTKSPTQPGRLIHKRLEEERAKQEAYRAKQSEKGAKGGRPSKPTGKPDESHGKPAALPQLNPGLAADNPLLSPRGPSSLSISSTSSTTSSIEDENKASSAGEADLPSAESLPLVEEQLGGAPKPAPRPKLYRHDKAPVFLLAEFHAYLVSQGYGHVDWPMYLLRIQEGARKGVYDTRKLKEEATNAEWQAFILKWLDGDKRNGCLLMPDNAPGRALPVPAYQPPATSTTMTGSIAQRVAAQATKSYL